MGVGSATVDQSPSQKHASMIGMGQPNPSRRSDSEPPIHSPTISDQTDSPIITDEQAARGLVADSSKGPPVPRLFTADPSLLKTEAPDSQLVPRESVGATAHRLFEQYQKTADLPVSNSDQGVELLQTRLKLLESAANLAKQGGDTDLFKRAGARLTADFDGLTNLYRTRGDTEALFALKMKRYEICMNITENFERAESLKDDLVRNHLRGDSTAQDRFLAQHAMRTLNRERAVSQIAFLDFAETIASIHSAAMMQTAARQGNEDAGNLQRHAAEGRAALIAEIRSLMTSGEAKNYREAGALIEKKRVEEALRYPQARRATQSIEEMRRHGFRKVSSNPFYYQNLFEVAVGDPLSRYILSIQDPSAARSGSLMIGMAQWARRERSFELAEALLKQVARNRSSESPVRGEAERILSEMRGDRWYQISDDTRRGVENALDHVDVKELSLFAISGAVGGLLAQAAGAMVKGGVAALRARRYLAAARLLENNAVRSGVKAAAGALGMNRSRTAIDTARGRPSEGFRGYLKDLALYTAIPMGKEIFGRLFKLAADQLPLVNRLVGLAATEERALLVFGRRLTQLSQGEKFFLTLTDKGRTAYHLGALGAETHLFMGFQAVEPALHLYEASPTQENLGYLENLLTNLSQIVLTRATNAAAGVLVEPAIRAVGKALKKPGEKSAGRRSGQNAHQSELFARALIGQALGTARDLFGFSPGEALTPEKVQSAFRKFARANHSDLNGSKGTSPVTVGEAKVLADLLKKFGCSSDGRLAEISPQEARTVNHLLNSLARRRAPAVGGTQSAKEARTAAAPVGALPAHSAPEAGSHPPPIEVTDFTGSALDPSIPAGKVLVDELAAQRAASRHVMPRVDEMNPIRPGTVTPIFVPPPVPRSPAPSQTQPGAVTGSVRPSNNLRPPPIQFAGPNPTTFSPRVETPKFSGYFGSHVVLETDRYETIVGLLPPEAAIRTPADDLHVTLIDKTDLEKLRDQEIAAHAATHPGEKPLSKGKAMERVKERVGQALSTAGGQPTVTGVGSATNAQAGHTVYFTTVDWPEAQKAREELGLPPKDLHITLASNVSEVDASGTPTGKPKDVHGVQKKANLVSFNQTTAEPDKTVSIDTIRTELQTYETRHGLRGLEGRVQRGLDPAGMLAVGETRAKLEQIAAKLGARMEDVERLTNQLHTGGIWTNADALASGTDPAVRVWMIAGEVTTSGKVKEGDLNEAEFTADLGRVNQLLDDAVKDPEGFAGRSRQNLLGRSRDQFKLDGDVPVSDLDSGFLAMAVSGHHSGIVRANDGLLFVGANELDYGVLERMGLHAEQREDRGRTSMFYVGAGGQPVVKKLYPGFAIVLNKDMEVAKALARTANPTASTAPVDKGNGPQGPSAPAGDLSVKSPYPQFQRRVDELLARVPEGKRVEAADAIRRAFEKVPSGTDPSQVGRVLGPELTRIDGEFAEKRNGNGKAVEQVAEARARLQGAGILTQAMETKIDFYKDYAGAEESIRTGFLSAAGQKGEGWEIRAYNQIRGLIHELDRRREIAEARKMDPTQGAPVTAAKVEYHGVASDETGLKVRAKSSTILKDIPELPGHILEVKFSPRLDYGENNDGTFSIGALNQAIKYNADLLSPSSPNRGATIEVTGSVSTEFIVEIEKRAPEVEVLYCFRLPSGQEIVFRIKQAPEGRPTLRRVPDIRKLPEADQRVVDGLRKLLQSGKLLKEGALQGRFLRLEDISLENPHYAKLAEAAEPDGSINPLKISDFGAYKEWEKLIHEKRVAYFTEKSATVPLRRSVEHLKRPASDEDIERYLAEAERFIARAPEHTRKQYTVTGDAKKARVRKEFAKRLKRISEFESARIGSAGEASIQAGRIAMGYSGPPEGYPLDVTHVYMDVVKGLNEAERGGKRPPKELAPVEDHGPARSYDHAHTFQTADQALADLRAGKYAETKHFVRVVFPETVDPDVGEQVTNAKEYDVTEPNVREKIVSDSHKRNMARVKELKRKLAMLDPPAEAEKMVPEERQALGTIKRALNGGVARVEGRLQELLAERNAAFVAIEADPAVPRHLKNKAKGEKNKEYEGRIRALEGELLKAYEKALGPRRYRQMFEYVEKEWSSDTVKFIYTIDSNGAMRAMHEELKPGSERPAHSQLSGGLNTYGAGQFWVKGTPVEGPDGRPHIMVLSVDDGSGHYRPDAYEMLPHVQNVLQEAGYDTDRTEHKHAPLPFVPLSDSFDTPINPWTDLQK